ncbi:MAG: hypothetical protein EB048_04050 [Gammaproteobacteria bacterium]|nr:hypothetical protein [Gammaproteobacteria bacterium]
MDHAIWVFVHVMLLVYWLGADLGVLLLAKAAKRPELSFAERAWRPRARSPTSKTPSASPSMAPSVTCSAFMLC